jgi:hypothetical protein
MANMFCRLTCVCLLLLVPVACPAWADPPVASYIFPAGGQRGTTVAVRVGGLNLHESCRFDMRGPGVEASPTLKRMKTVWFEGPILPLPDSQRAEDYPKDMAGQVAVAADAPLGIRHGRVWTSQGATSALRFDVGDLPEMVEEEIDGQPIPVAVTLPLTVNGRIFPREDVDIWTFEARRGQAVTCEVTANRLGSPLDARLEVVDPQGRPIAENDDGSGSDPALRFTAPADGRYQVRIHDINFLGSQAHVYRLTLTAGPRVDRVFPLGGRRGSTVNFALAGQGVPGKPTAIALPADTPTDYGHRLKIGDAFTNRFLLDVDDLPERVTGQDDRPVSSPVILNGRIDRPGEIDSWPLELHKGDALDFELRAGRLGSPLDGVLTLLSPEGKEVARAEAAAKQLDPVLTFKVPADGTYQVQVRDRFRSRGGPEFAYRLRIAPAQPGFLLQMPSDALTVERGGQAVLKLTAERLGGFAEPISLTVEGLPDGVSVTGTQIAARQTNASLVFKAEATAKIQATHVVIRGNAKAGDQVLSSAATMPTARGEPPLDSLFLGVAMPTPFQVVGEYTMSWSPRGTVYVRHYRIERNGFNGPLEIRLADRQARHLQGVAGPVLTVPAGASEFDYPITLPAWIETGRTSRTCVMAVGKVKDADGSEHVVCFSSTKQNDQVVVVPGPGRLGIEVDRHSLIAKPGGSAVLTVRIVRDRDLRGPVRLELLAADHMRGLKAEPVVIPADRDSFELPVQFAEDLAGPFNMPAVIRATLMENGKPFMSEARVEILSQP